MHLLDTLALLSVALLIAKLLGGVLARVGIPSILAELLAGVILGNLGVLDGLQSSEIVHGFSELGVLFLLFYVGLETDIKEIGKVGINATMAAVAGVIAPFVLAFIFVPQVAETNFQHTLFMAAALTATSVGITARVLQETGKLQSVSGRIILGAAVIDDILGIIVLTIVSALVTQGSVSGSEIGILLGKILMFGVAVIVARRLVIHPVLQTIRPLEVAGTLTVLVLSQVLLASWAAEKMGLAGIIGAFAFGVILDDVQFKGYRDAEKYSLETLMKPIIDFFVPIFFIVMGMGVKIPLLLNPEAMSLAVVLIVSGILGKLACGLVLTQPKNDSKVDRLLVGLGMMPRGEVGLIFAAMGQRLGVLKDADYAAVVTMVAVTTLLAPIAISWRAKRA